MRWRNLCGLVVLVQIGEFGEVSSCKVELVSNGRGEIVARFVVMSWAVAEKVGLVGLSRRRVMVGLGKSESRGVSRPVPGREDGRRRSVVGLC